MKNIVGWFVGFAAVSVLAGCDGSSGGTCASAAACGGDIVGSWKVTSSCIDLDLSGMDSGFDCDGVTTRASGFKVTGDITYRADGTFSRNSTVTGNVVVTIPSACLVTNGITLTCAQIQQASASNLADEYTSIKCSGSSSCTCTAALAPVTSTATGTYSTTAAGLLTETDAGGAPEQSDYCVKGSTLTESSHADGMMGQADVTGTVTLTKQ